jgi:hypothetical protein
MTNPDAKHGRHVWLAQHRAELRRHVAQCWTRRAWLSAAQCVDAVHESLSRRFATTVFAAGGLMLLLTQWP